jgi:hypothetical protein
MKFDTLIENYLNVFSEAYVNRSSKYSNIEIDTEKMLEKLNAGDFDILLSTWANNPKYGNISEDVIKKLITDLASDINNYEISSFDDLKETIDSLADSIYENKGIRRQSYVERLTNSIASLVMHKEYELVTAKEPRVEKPEEDSLTGLTEVENGVVDYIEHSEDPVTIEDLNKNFSNAQDILDSLVNKKIVFIGNDGIITLSGPRNIETFEDEDEDFSSELGLRKTFGFEDENSVDLSGRPSWKRSNSEARYRELE